MAVNFLYAIDILKNGFEQKIIPLNADYEGGNIATLVRRLFSDGSKKAVLYIHGFNDYFFQTEMAVEFNNHGYNFYALDLRKYGRSYLPHQKFNDIRNLNDYFEEITNALNIIRAEKNEQVVLLGHSTGGLIVTLYAKANRNSELFDGLILNSPFFEFNKNILVRAFIPLVSYLGKLFPRIKISGGFTEKYGESIHRSFGGEWDYNLEWKPNIAPKINLGWLRAIHQGHKQLKGHIVVDKPVLVLHSAQSVTNLNDREQIYTRDSILNVKDIVRIAGRIEGNTTIVAIEGGLHDLVLSEKTVRDKVYKTIFEWVERNINK
ncbi:alpha/beta hydrolase [Dysgonomonas sp. Marseille-P4677]|uniref:alpha/beta hydrolase n=1 Tax=Dysgonomonas sp. Marseille-P4677 TaxID=2364790 RepID=UPI00191420DB|nr:alpha/beta hydrolase [Dysgonomonas sp. Marseille-P4677]MBK5721251.1 alpha/beta hydrolase [Dysgonomonas sp. Marseille-P4677]